jgi:hypothetical protein
VTLEELRAFLTSLFVAPARSRNWVAWIRSWTTDRVKPAPIHPAPAQTPGSTGAAATPTTTGLAK